MVLDFSHLVSDVANPLFKHIFSNGNNRSYSESKWFDSECAQAKRIYKDALAIFNNNNSTESRLSLCNKKKSYKSLIRKKKRAYKINMADELTRLKNSKPKDFGSILKTSGRLLTHKFLLMISAIILKGFFSDIQSTFIEQVENLNSNSD
jgi:hypothetical protein